MIESLTPEGIVLVVRVIPRARKSGVAGTRGDALLVRLQAPAVEDAANIELVRVLADALGVSRRAVSIKAGHHSRLKRIQVSGIDPQTAAKCLKLKSGGAS